MTNDELLDKWRHVVNASDHIFTWTETLTLCWLAEQASKAKLAAEVGVYMGRASRVMCDAGVGHLWSIDPFMVAGTQKVTEYFLRDYIRSGVCEVIPKHTEPAAAMLQHLKGKLDFAFIDDGHAYEDVLTDIEYFLPLVKSGGILCGHDLERNPDNEVKAAVDKLLPGYTEPIPRLWCYQKP
jgi:predicted O-methyltransferase YrrM